VGKNITFILRFEEPFISGKSQVEVLLNNPQATHLGALDLTVWVD
jgi:hypothetical protein